MRSQWDFPRSPAPQTARAGAVLSCHHPENFIFWVKEATLLLSRENLLAVHFGKA